MNINDPVYAEEFPSRLFLANIVYYLHFEERVQGSSF